MFSWGVSTYLRSAGTIKAWLSRPWKRVHGWEGERVCVLENWTGIFHLRLWGWKDLLGKSGWKISFIFVRRKIFLFSWTGIKMCVLIHIMIYVLQLTQGKFYVGKSDNIPARFQAHLDGRGCEWTKLYQIGRAHV